jgi:WD40 repeat protein
MMCRLARLWLGLWALLAADSALAQEAPLSNAPLLRIETGQHGAAINRIALRPAEGLMVSVSDDKTARLWSLATGDLLSVLRGPIGAGPEGSLYGVALSPSGKTIAVAGHTGLAWDKTSSIYLFARESGQWLGRITVAEGRTDAINHLAFSPDGEKIAVGANDGRGLRIIEPSQRRITIVDDAYKDAIVWLDFAADGRLVASSIDGGVRLYDPAFKRLATWRAEAGLKPWSVAFSPDGQKIAVGFLAGAQVRVLSAADLKPLQDLKGGAGHQGGLSVIAWAADGKSLYAVGT